MTYPLYCLHPCGEAVAMAVKERTIKAKAFMMFLWDFESFRRVGKILKFELIATNEIDQYIY